MNQPMTDQQIRAIVEKVVGALQAGAPAPVSGTKQSLPVSDNGVFTDMDSAIEAAHAGRS
jgi:hypothetical protein